MGLFYNYSLNRSSATTSLFSSGNLKKMRIFYEEWQCLSIGSPMANQLQQFENKIEEGVTGKVARISGQQRVVVEISGLCLVATAYIPNGFLETVQNQL